MTANLEKPQAMIFDLDGTLFKTETLLLPAYHALFDQLRAEGLHEGETPPEEIILGSLGMVLEDIWRKVIPDSSENVRRRADVLLLYHQMEGLKRGDGVMYDGVTETLRELRARDIRLFIASNGLENYVKHVVRHKGLADVFENLYSAGEYETGSKVDLVRLLLDRHEIKSAWMVGDRFSDVEAGRRNGLFVVGCAYAGFGKGQELEGADVRIERFSDLLNLLGKE